jgi:phosphate transport system substrate-binding protein
MTARRVTVSAAANQRGERQVVKHRFAISIVTLAMFAVACGGGGATTKPATPAPATSGAATPAATTPTAATATPASGTTGPSTPAASEQPTTGAETPAASLPTVEGNVDIHGSSTVAPISNAVAEELALGNPGFSYTVGDEGTGAGFADFFCVGQSDISDASRKIKPDDPAVEGDEEATICAANGVEYAELKIGYDGLAVITAAANPIECLTFADLYALMGPESDSVANWQDAQALATQLGSTSTLPDAPLSITAPGTESGTYDSFIELVMAKFIAAQFTDAVADNTHLRTPGDIYVASPNDNAIIQGVAGFPTSLGFVGLAYAEENTDTVKMIAIDKGDGNCVLPTRETVSDATYPISRPLFIYPNLGKAAENAAIDGYVDFYLSDTGIANVGDVGYVPLPQAELDATRAAWEAAKP